jgi:hypothetical protein
MITVGGSWDATGGTITADDSTVLLNGTNNITLTPGGQAFNNLTVNDGLVGYWKMDETSWNGTSGEVLDASGNNNHGVRAGDATTTAGKYGSGGSFDGDGDGLSVPNSSLIRLVLSILSFSK